MSRIYFWCSDWIGYVFCEVFFRVSRILGATPVKWHANDIDLVYAYPTHRAASAIGGKLYSIGCWFYGRRP